MQSINTIQLLLKALQETMQNLSQELRDLVAQETVILEGKKIQEDEDLLEVEEIQEEEILDTVVEEEADHQEVVEEILDGVDLLEVDETLGEVEPLAEEETGKGATWIDLIEDLRKLEEEGRVSQKSIHLKHALEF